MEEADQVATSTSSDETGEARVVRNFLCVGLLALFILLYSLSLLYNKLIFIFEPSYNLPPLFVTSPERRRPTLGGMYYLFASACVYY